MKPVIYMDHTIKLQNSSFLHVMFHIYRRGKLIDKASDMALARQKIRALQAKVLP